MPARHYTKFSKIKRKINKTAAEMHLESMIRGLGKAWVLGKDIRAQQNLFSVFLNEFSLDFFRDITVSKKIRNPCLTNFVVRFLNRSYYKHSVSY